MQASEIAVGAIYTAKDSDTVETLMSLFHTTSQALFDVNPSLRAQAGSVAQTSQEGEAAQDFNSAEVKNMAVGEGVDVCVPMCTKSGKDLFVA
mmetsp:Transcript_28586/g.72864  ORF Transcript_28586/g.72864 Transcript_28586/m.72864 type:complete len:93 (-) Transcript_28586:57-335(-)